MHPDRIAALLAPFLGGNELTPDDLDRISTYIDMLQHWNARINLTAIRDPEEIVTRHFGESLFTARLLYPRSLHTAGPHAAGTSVSQAAERRQIAAHGASRGSNPAPDSAAEQRQKPTLADIGSGAGFPGLPIKLWAPHVAVTLIESNQKKSTFLREIARALTLTDINIQSVRAEALPPASFATVTLRAVERFHQILPTAANLMAGRLALLISSSQVAAAKPLLANYDLSDPYPIPGSASRILLLAHRREAVRAEPQE